MKNKKIVLITIIVLLIIFLPLTIIGYFAKEPTNNSENPNHDFFYNGYLWFYANDNSLIGKYECQTSKCNLPSYSIDDDEYNLPYYQDGTINTYTYNGSSHAFITDGEMTYLYDIKEGFNIKGVKQIKTYNTNLKDNLYIVQDDKNYWGLVRINPVKENGLTLLIPFEYDFIGLKNNLDENNNLITDNFIVKKGNNWFIQDINGKALCNYIPMPIVDYSNSFVIGKDENYHIYDIKNDTKEIYTDYTISDYAFIEDYRAIVSKNTLYVFNQDNLLKNYPLSSSDTDIVLEKNATTLTIKNNGIILDSIAFN